MMDSLIVAVSQYLSLLHSGRGCCPSGFTFPDRTRWVWRCRRSWRWSRAGTPRRTPVLVVAGLLAGPAGWLAIVLYVLAGVMLATSAVSFCPLYALFGLRTRPEEKATSSAA